MASTAIKDYHNGYKVNPPGVVTGRSGSLGTIQYISGKYWPLNTTLYTIDYKGNFPKYVYYFLKTMHLENFNSGAGVPTLNQNHLHKLKIKIPPKKVQKKIAAILSAYDDLIENNKRRIDLLEKMAEEIYREWFVRMRFPGHKKNKFEKGIPVDWQYEKLDDLCSLIKRGISPSYNDDSELLVINQRCIRDGNIDLSLARVHNTKIPTVKLLQYGDAIINSTGVGTLGRVSIVEYEPVKLTVDSHVTICRADTTKVNLRYLSYSIKKLQGYFEYMATGATGQVELNQGLIAGTKILVPNPELQDKFSNIIGPIWSKRSALTFSVNILKSSRDMLLPRLISGKFSVEELDIKSPPSMQDEQDVVHA